MPNQTFWMEILIPRAVWPEKARFFARRQICKGLLRYEGRPLTARPLLYSVSLIIHAVLPHCSCMGRFYSFFLWCVGAVAVWGPGLPRVTVFALLPWWIDFDQDFAPYMGGTHKIWDLYAAVLSACDGPTHRRPEKLRIAGAECLYDHQPTWRRFDAGMF